MTCVWNALISSICCEDFHNILDYKEGIKPHPQEFVKLLKDRSINTDNILWNGEELLKQQIDENFVAVNQLDINTINNGYMCSIFDPFIFLVCELFEISIEHNYNGNVMIYKNIKNSRYILKFKSDTGHFSCV